MDHRVSIILRIIMVDSSYLTPPIQTVNLNTVFLFIWNIPLVYIITSKKSSLIALSSIEAEFIRSDKINVVAKLIIWLRQFLVGYPPVKLTKQYMRLTHQRFISYTMATTNDEPHMDIRYLYVEELVNLIAISIEYMPNTADMSTDILNKAIDNK